MLKVVTLCSGYDSQCMALDRLGIDYDLIAWSEIDKYAIQAHNALYPQYAGRNLGDMTKIDWNKVSDFDLLTYSTPCQSISSAGLQHGFAEGSGTRSSIIWFVCEAIKVKRPKYLMLENVAAMVQSKFLPMFHLWQHELEKYGYHNYAQVLNAKDYEVPQNRERVFMISKLDNEPYYFPKPIKLDKRLKDVLEDNVDEKYYLSDKILKGFYEHNKKHIKKKTGFIFKPKDINEIASCIRANAAISATDNAIKIEPQIQQVGNFVDDSNRCFKNPQYGRVYDTNGLSPTIMTFQGGNREPKIISCTRDYPRIRRLTERECFRLMGVDDTYIDKIQSTGISKSQQYKMAGNSIVVDCLYHIFRKLFINKESEHKQTILNFN